MSPAASPWASMAETHVSVVFFAGDFAYKQLKPFKAPFLDHSTIALRRQGAADETELNRRLAPDVYLGVTPVMDGDTEVDYLIVMRRMPADRRLSSMTDSMEFDEQLRAVARTVASFHASLEPEEEAVTIASIESEAQRWADNLSEFNALGNQTHIDTELLAEIDQLYRHYLEGRADLFSSRAQAGMARDGHGDLLADDIFCLDDGPRILDCLAFDPKLRKGDVLADIAFLVMDIERIGGERAARRLLGWYQEFSNEHHPTSLAHFYVAYRALVRAKVTTMRCLQLSDPGGMAEAHRYLRQCLDHLERAQPTLVLVGGGPGTGKSTLADAIGGVMHWPTLSSDELRKDLAGTPHDEHAFAEADEGLYKPEVTADTYGELCHQATQLLRSGESVILDASWSTAEHRAGARAVAEKAGARLVEIECVLDPSIAKERIVRRMSSPWNVSDATPAIVDHLAGKHDPWPEAITIDTARAPLECRSDAVKAVLGFAVPDRGPL